MKTSYQITILQKLLAGDTLTSRDIPAINANQYYCTVKNAGIELIEVRSPNTRNNGTHLKRSLAINKENIKRAVNYLRQLQRKA